MDSRSESGDCAGRKTRPQACERCWRRKQKCDKLLPACSACAELGVPCTTRRPDTAVVSREGSLSLVSIPGYVTSLKRKVEDLEQSLRKRQARPGIQGTSPSVRGRSSHSHQISADKVLPEYPSPSSLSVDRSAAPVSSDDRSVRATMGNIGYLSLSAMAEPRDKSDSFAHYLDLENMVKAAIEAPKIASPSAFKTQDNTIYSMHLQGAMAIQSPVLTWDATFPYISCYIDNIGPLLGGMDKSQVIRQYEETIACYSVVNTAEKSNDSASRDFQTLIAIAIGALLVPEASRLEAFILSLQTAAMKKFSLILQIEDDITIIKSLLLITIYSIYSTHGGSPWHLFGLTLKRSFRSRLHKDPDPQIGLTESEISTRRRLFWQLFMLDRSLSSAMDRPFSIEFADISAQEPLKPAVNEAPQPPVTFDQHLYIQAILITSIRNTPSADALYEFSNFCFWRDLPPEQRFLGDVPAHYTDFLEQLSCRTLLNIVTPNLCVNNNERIRSKLEDIEEDTRASCLRFINLLYDRFDQGIAYIYLTLQSRKGFEKRRIQITQMVNMCSGLLTVIGEKFPTLKDFRRILDAMSQLTADGSTLEGSRYANILQNLPRVIPAQTRKLIDQFLVTKSGSAGN